MQVRVALRFRVRFPVPEQVALFQHWAPHGGAVPVWGRPHPSSSTGRKNGPSSITGPVPIEGLIYIYVDYVYNNTEDASFLKRHVHT